MKSICSRLKAKSKQILVLYMPESSEVSHDVPDIARELMDEILKTHLPEAMVLDFHSLLEREEFYDGIHPNEAGRRKLDSELLKALIPPDKESSIQQ